VSKVTDVILLHSLSEEVEEDRMPPPILSLNKWLTEEKYGSLDRVDGWAGGNKAFQAFAWMGAFNYFHAKAFIEQVRAQEWEDRDSVQVLIKEEEEVRFTLYNRA
jgi:hypothetical protein